MADLTDFWQGDWKRDWLKLYEWQRGRTIKQVIRECLTGNCSDIVEQEVKRRMSGAETATILNVDCNAASASKALNRASHLAHRHHRQTSLLIVIMTTKSGDAVRTGTAKGGGMQRPRRSRASPLAHRHHRLHRHYRYHRPKGP